MPTLQDVAHKAGVSTATVSKVLSNTPYFSEATRKKVMKAVEDVGYVPNLAARALTTGKTNIIGVVFPYIYETIFEDVMIMSMLRGIESECRKRNHSILLSTPRIDEHIDMQFQMLVQSGYFDGMISLDSIQQTSFSEFATENGIPSVVIGYHQSDYYVRCDDFTGSRDLMKHIVSLGHRNIGIITVPENTNIGIDKRIDGVRDICEEVGIEIGQLPIAYGDYSIESGQRGMETLLDEHPDLTAIVSINDRMAIGAIQYLQSIGKCVPQDMTVVGFDNIEHSQLITPALTTVDQRPVEQGKKAAHMLFDVLDGKSPDSVVLDTRLILRGSSAPPSA